MSAPNRSRSNVVARCAFGMGEQEDPRSSEAIGLLLESFRPHLQRWALGQIPKCLKGKLCVSDVVQETLVCGWESFTEFHGRSHRELAGWLRRILSNRLKSAFRFWIAQRRDARLERPLVSAPADP